MGSGAGGRVRLARSWGNRLARNWRNGPELGQLGECAIPVHEELGLRTEGCIAVSTSKSKAAMGIKTEHIGRHGQIHWGKTPNSGNIDKYNKDVGIMCVTQFD